MYWGVIGSYSSHASGSPSWLTRRSISRARRRPELMRKEPSRSGSMSGPAHSATGVAPLAGCVGSAATWHRITSTRSSATACASGARRAANSAHVDASSTTGGPQTTMSRSSSPESTFPICSRPRRTAAACALSRGCSSRRIAGGSSGRTSRIRRLSRALSRGGGAARADSRGTVAGGHCAARRRSGSMSWSAAARLATAVPLAPSRTPQSAVGLGGQAQALLSPQSSVTKRRTA